MAVQLWNIPSRVLQRTVPVQVVVPDAPSGKWLLLLHGYDGDEWEWTQRSPIAELAQEAGLLLVAPSCGNGYYEDTSEPMGQFLGEELVRFVTGHFPVSSRQEDTFIAGASMGGFGSLLIGARYSAVFGKILSFGGAFIIHDICIGNPAIVANADIRYFHRVFGDFFTLEGSERDPMTHVQKALDGRCMPPVQLLCGEQDRLYRSNEKLYHSLQAMGVSVQLVTVPGGHGWSAWCPHIKAMIQWLCLEQTEAE